LGSHFEKFLHLTKDSLITETAKMGSRGAH
jgi:hypothetical protein